MGQLEIDEPLLVARSGKTSIITSGNGLNDPMTNAQLWSQERGYSDVRPLGVHLKWLYYVQEVNSPEPWIEPK